MSLLVLDTAFTMAWCFSDAATELSKALLGRLANLTDTAIVPALWLYEVSNVAELAVRKGRIAGQRVRDFLESLSDLPTEIEQPAPTKIFVSVRALAAQHKLTVYDASYLELAIRGLARRHVRSCSGKSCEIGRRRARRVVRRPVSSDIRASTKSADHRR